MENSLHVILDIDETLVQTVDLSLWESIPPHERRKYTVEMLDDDPSTEIDVVILRPHVKEFIKFLAENFTVDLWTWGNDVYADAVAGILGKKYFSHIWSEKDTEKSKDMNGYAKDLRYIWNVLKIPGYTKNNTLLIDDLFDNTKTFPNRNNSLTIKAFTPFPQQYRKTDELIYQDVSNDNALMEIKVFLKNFYKVGPTEIQNMNISDSITGRSKTPRSTRR